MGEPMTPPRVIVLHGPPASGKHTIALELSRVAGLPLFHNHLTVDLLLALFPFGSPAFAGHRERIWLDLMADAVGAGSSLIFTFNPERTVSSDFPAVLAARIRERGGATAFVQVECPESEIERRIESDSRRAFRKLASLEVYRRLKREGAFEFPPMPSQVRVDSSKATAREAAERIAAALGLQAPPSPG
jgi:chloramphenicol 3-O-phosphotransferase